MYQFTGYSPNNAWNVHSRKVFQWGANSLLRTSKTASAKESLSRELFGKFFSFKK